MHNTCPIDVTYRYHHRKNKKEKHKDSHDSLLVSERVVAVSHKLFAYIANLHRHQRWKKCFSSEILGDQEKSSKGKKSC